MLPPPPHKLKKEMPLAYVAQYASTYALKGASYSKTTCHEGWNFYLRVYQGQTPLIPFSSSQSAWHVTRLTPEKNVTLVARYNVYGRHYQVLNVAQ